MLQGELSNELESHLLGCSDCRAEQVALVRIRETLREPSLWEEPPPDLAERIASLGRAAVTETRRQISSRIFLPVTAGLGALLVAGFLLVSTPADWEFDLKGVGDGATASAVVAGWNEAEGTRLRIEVDGIEPPPPDHLTVFTCPPERSEATE
jgi:anti-sigma factor RsiW